MKQVSEFLSEKMYFLVVKILYLNRRVFVMSYLLSCTPASF